jgi:hypothetical protein
MTWVPSALQIVLASGSCAAGVLLLIAVDRRVVLTSLAVLIVASSSLLIGRVPLVVSLALMTSGLAATAIILLSTSAKAWPWLAAAAGALPEGRPFRLTLSAFVLMAVLGLAPGVNLPGLEIPRPVIVTALGLIGLGALQLGLSERSLRVCVGLLTVLAGFETLYFILEPSLGIVALLGSVNVVVALIASYLLLVVRQEPTGDRAP